MAGKSPSGGLLDRSIGIEPPRLLHGRAANYGSIFDPVCLSLPGMEEPLDDVDSKGKEDGLHIPPDMLKLAGFLDLDDLTYTVENGRIIIEREDY